MHQLWFYEPLLAFLKLRKFLSTLLNLIFVSLTYYHLSSLMKVERVLMVKTSVASIFFLWRKAQKIVEKVTQKAGCEIFFIWITDFFSFPIQFQVFAFSILQFFPRISLRRSMHFLTFIVSKISSVYRYAAFPVAMLYNLSLSVWLNWFIIAIFGILAPLRILRHIICREGKLNALIFRWKMANLLKLEYSRTNFER